MNTALGQMLKAYNSENLFERKNAVKEIMQEIVLCGLSRAGGFEKLYFDIAGDPEPVALDMLRMVAPDDHIVFGSDFPHSPARVILMKKKHFDENVKWDGIRKRIYSGNNLVTF